MRRSGLSVGAIVLFLVTLAAPLWAQATASSKLGPLARGRSLLSTGSSRVIVRTDDPQGTSALSDVIVQAGARPERLLPIINGWVANVPNAALAGLAHNPLVAHIAADRLVFGSLERTGAAIGATTVRQETGLDGSGIGVAVIDSGVTAWHDDLTGAGGQRVLGFVDFVGGRPDAYDDYGHGTHVAGIIAGNGFDSGGGEAGLRPGPTAGAQDAGRGGLGPNQRCHRRARLHCRQQGRASHRASSTCRCRPGSTNRTIETRSTVACKRVVDAGIVVVAAAGNAGRDAHGVPLYGGTTAPGNAPWVVTVGTSNHQGTTERSDDTVAAFSSRGPSSGGLCGEAGHRRTGRRDRVAERSRQPAVLHEVGVPARRHGA